MESIWKDVLSEWEKPSVYSDLDEINRVFRKKEKELKDAKKNENTLEQQIDSYNNYIPFKFASPNPQYKDKNLQKLYDRSWDPSVIAEERSLKKLRDFMAFCISSDSDEILIKNRKTKDLLPISNMGLKLNTGLLRDHVDGVKDLYLKNTGKNSYQAIVEVSGENRKYLTKQVIEALHISKKRPTTSKKVRPLVLDYDDKCYVFYSLKENTPVSLIQESFKEALRLKVDLNNIKILPDGESMMKFPFQVECSRLYANNPLECDKFFSYKKGVGKAEEALSDIQFNKLEKIVPIIDKRVLYGDNDYKFVNNSIPKSLFAIAQYRKERKKEEERDSIGRIKRKTKHEHYSIPTFLLHNVPKGILERVEKRVKNHINYKMVSLKNCRASTSKRRLVRYCLLSFCYFYNQTVLDRNGSDYAYPSTLMKGLDDQYRPLMNVFEELFTKKTSEYSSSLHVRKCRRYSLDIFRKVVNELIEEVNFVNPEDKENLKYTNKYIINIDNEYSYILRHNNEGGNKKRRKSARIRKKPLPIPKEDKLFMFS